VGSNPTPSANGNYMYPDSDKHLSYETEDTIYWFSHAFDPLNNWSAHAVMIDNQHFSTVEHGFHYYKFVETAPDVAQKILAAPSPWAAMQIERQHKDKRRSDWQDVKVGIMTKLVRAKAEQNEDFAACLLATGDKHLVENSPWDDFWGVGSTGKGLNKMGEILEQIRSQLRASEE
jgi:ribA/ribD-fused uncharacterized protein